jgi:hypothetical protein
VAGDRRETNETHGKMCSGAYAERNDRDYQALATAVSAGKITAQTGL